MICLFHLQYVENIAAYGTWIHLLPTRRPTLSTYDHQESILCNCMPTEGKNHLLYLSSSYASCLYLVWPPVTWLQLIDIKNYLSSFFLIVISSSPNISHISDFQVYDIKPSYLLRVILCHRGTAHLIRNPSDTPSCSHSIKFSCDIIAICLLSYIKYLFCRIPQVVHTA